MITTDFRIIIEKIEELCTLLLEQQAYNDFTQKIEQYKADEQATMQYERFIELQQSIQHKEQQSVEVTAAEREVYNLEERALYDNSVIRKFLFSHNELDILKHTLNEYVNITIALGRLPIPRELPKVSHGCGSHAKI